MVSIPPEADSETHDLYTFKTKPIHAVRGAYNRYKSNLGNLL